MEDDIGEFINEKSLRNTIMGNKDKNSNSFKLNKKSRVLLIIFVICGTITVTGLLLYHILSNRNNNKLKPYELEQEFSVTVEIFKYRKGKGEKEHEIPNLNKSVYFLSEEFKCIFKKFYF